MPVGVTVGGVGEVKVLAVVPLELCGAGGVRAALAVGVGQARPAVEVENGG